MCSAASRRDVLISSEVVLCFQPGKIPLRGPYQVFVFLGFLTFLFHMPHLFLLYTSSELKTHTIKLIWL